MDRDWSEGCLKTTRWLQFDYRGYSVTCRIPKKSKNGHNLALWPQKYYQKLIDTTKPTSWECFGDPSKPTCGEKFTQIELLFFSAHIAIAPCSGSQVSSFCSEVSDYPIILVILGYRISLALVHDNVIPPFSRQLFTSPGLVEVYVPPLLSSLQGLNELPDRRMVYSWIFVL